jgi:hypothetical protein
MISPAISGRMTPIPMPTIRKVLSRMWAETSAAKLKIARPQSDRATSESISAHRQSAPLWPWALRIRRVPRLFHRPKKLLSDGGECRSAQIPNGIYPQMGSGLSPFARVHIRTGAGRFFGTVVEMGRGPFSYRELGV